MDILSILKMEHEEIRARFVRLEATSGAKDRLQLMTELTRDLELHLNLERDYFYPEIASLFTGAKALVDIGLANGRPFVFDRVRALSASLWSWSAVGSGRRPACSSAAPFGTPGIRPRARST